MSFDVASGAFLPFILLIRCRMSIRMRWNFSVYQKVISKELLAAMEASGHAML